MVSAKFESLQSRIQELYHAGDYTNALELIQQQGQRFPDQAVLWNYWRITLRARLGDLTAALATLQAVLDSGFWYSDTLLRRSPALKALQGLPEFQALLRRNAELRQADEDQVYPLITLRSSENCRPGGPGCPALIALHPNASSPQACAFLWSPVAKAGWLVALPQSSQAMWKGGYAWNDLKSAAYDVAHSLRTLCGQYAIDRRRLVLAGNAAGGETALNLALSFTAQAVRDRSALDEDACLPTAFLAVDPSGPLFSDPELLEAILRDRPHNAPPIYGALALSAATAEEHASAVRLAARLSAAGIPCQVERSASLEVLIMHLLREM